MRAEIIIRDFKPNDKRIKRKLVDTYLDENHSIATSFPFGMKDGLALEEGLVQNIVIDFKVIRNKENIENGN